jgi:hypothetical protein
LIEIQDRQQLVVHPDVAKAVDLVLRGHELSPNLRYRDEKGEIQVEQAPYQTMERNGARNGRRLASRPQSERPAAGRATGRPVHVYPYGVARNRLIQAARRLNVPVQIVDDPGAAETMVTLKSYYRRRPRAIIDAERRSLPVFVLRANTVAQMENFLIDWFRLEIDADPTERALQEVDKAIHKVLDGKVRVDLAPQPPHLRRKQHEMARQHNLASRSYGKDPRRWVRIYRE